jgi:hypothetical protein
MNGFTSTHEVQANMRSKINSHVQSHTTGLRPSSLVDRLKSGLTGMGTKMRARVGTSRDAFCEVFEAEAFRQEVLSRDASVKSSRSIKGRVFGYLLNTLTNDEFLILEGENQVFRRNGSSEISIKLRALRDSVELEEVGTWKSYQSNDALKIGTSFFLLKIIPEKYRKNISLRVNAELGGVS